MRDFKLVADSIENLSIGGLLVGPSDPVLTGEHLFLSFKLPCSGEWIDTEGYVARVVHGRRDQEFTRQLGVKFCSLQPSAMESVRQQTRSVPPLPPLARPGRRSSGSATDMFALGSGWASSSSGHALIRWWDR